MTYFQCIPTSLPDLMFLQRLLSWFHPVHTHPHSGTHTHSPVGGSCVGFPQPADRQVGSVWGRTSVSASVYAVVKVLRKVPSQACCHLAGIQICSAHLSKTFLEGVVTGKRTEANVCSWGQNPSTEARKTQKNSDTFPFYPVLLFPTSHLPSILGNSKTR